MRVLTVRRARRLAGSLSVPGDKSISHRVALLGALAAGTTRASNFLPSADCRATLRLFRALGVRGSLRGNRLILRGAGLTGLKAPKGTLDAGNSGTTARLMLGVLAAQPFVARLTGDRSLRRRPMARVTVPLSCMGARFSGPRGADRLPLRIRGGSLVGRRFRLKVASAQVKSALLLAGLFAKGKTSVFEPAASRDHTERLFRAFGIPLKRRGRTVEVSGPVAPFRGLSLRIPGDFSSAAFFLVAALIVPGSRLLLRNVGVNPTRTGLLDVLRAMGARLRVRNRRTVSGEPVADLEASYSVLRGVRVPPALAPRMIDEYPILAVAATQARGSTWVRGAAELRVKESDRIAAMERTLSRMGARIRALPDGWHLEGPSKLHGAKVSSGGDHRVAMSLAVAALVSEGKTVVGDAENIGTSFPGFESLLRRVVVK